MNTIVHVIKVFGDNEKLIRNMDVMVSTQHSFDARNVNIEKCHVDRVCDIPC